MYTASRAHIVRWTCLFFWFGWSAAFAQGTPTYDLSIDAQPLKEALKDFAQQSGLQVVFYTDLAAGVTAPAVKGRLTSDEALSKLLKDTRLTYRHINDNTVEVSAGSLKEISRGPGVGLRLARNAAQAGDGSATQERASQETQAPPAEPDGARIEEVIVTAAKRASSVQDLPMSVEVIGSQEIERRGLIGMEDYMRSMPGVNQIDTGGKDNSIVIRGVATSPAFENFNTGTTVSTYFDEAPITGAGGPTAGGIDMRPVDIERIEVLRGPQGTAYGSSSLGGTLRIIPVKPKLEGFGGKVVAAYSGTGELGGDNSIFQAVLNIPVVQDKLAVRAVGYRYDDSGFYENIAAADPTTTARAAAWGIGNELSSTLRDDVGRMTTTGGRLSALWRVSDRFDVSLSYVKQKIEQDGLPEASAGAYTQIRYPLPAPARVDGDLNEAADSLLDLWSAVLNYDLGWAALTSAASGIDADSAQSYDALALGFPLTSPASIANSSYFQSFTNETRLASKLSGPFQFLGGLYYEKLEQGELQVVAGLGPLAPNPALTDPESIFNTDRTQEQRAIFGEVSYDITSKLTATVGGRFFRYDKDDRTLRQGGRYGVPLGGAVPGYVDTVKDGTSYKASVSFKPAENAMLYALWSQGFRLGRPTSGLPVNCDSNNDGVVDGTGVSMASTRNIDPDFLDNYEIGAKFSLFERRLVVNSSAYRIDWTGLPISIVAPVCNIGYTANVGAATSQGVELQASLLVVDGLRLDFGGGYVEAELSKPGLGAPAGARLPGSPKVNANLAAQYDFEVAGHKAFVRADSFYTGEFYGNLLQTPFTRAGDYIKVDARAGVAVKQLSVELFVRNLTNQDDFTWRSISNLNPLFGYRLRPRTIGVQLGYSFE